MLAEEMPNARLIEADSLVELRMQPERLTGEIAAFLDEVWAKPRATRAKAPAAKAGKRAAAKRTTASKPASRKAAKAPAKRPARSARVS